MTDRNADMRHILAQVRLHSGGTVVDEAAITKKSLAQGMPGLMKPTPKNIERAKQFLLNKWIDRFHERYPHLAAQEPKDPDYPVDLSNSCKFTSLFAQAVFGGILRGNEGHQFVQLNDGSTLDLNIDAADVREMRERFERTGKSGWHNDATRPGEGWFYHGDPHQHDPKFFGNRDHIESMRSVMPRVADWVKEFTGKAKPTSINESEQSDQSTRDTAESAFAAVRDFLTRHADYLPDVLQSVRDGDFALRGSKVGLARDLVIVFTHTGHSGIGSAGSNDVILVNCLRRPNDTTYLETRFGTGGHDSFVHEYAHYLSLGRPYHNSVQDYEKHGESAYYANPEEINANYIESTAGFRRMIKSIVEYASPEQLTKYTDMTDQQLYEFLRQSCVKPDVLKHLDARARRRFDKRCIRFIAQTIRPILMAGKVSESLTEQRVTVWSGATINVLHNPNKRAFENAISGDVQVLRGLMSDDGRDLYLWDAYMAVHPNIIQELGLGNYDCIMYVRGRWNGPVRGLDGLYKPAIERITPTPPPTAAERERDAKLLQAIFDDPDFAKIMGESQSYTLPKD